MAARNTDVTVGSTYTQLTDNNVTNISFQNKGSALLEVVAVASGTPAESVRGCLYEPREGEDNLTLADRWLGVTSPARVWARFVNSNGSVWVSHSA
jgi:hypothetical protein